jgi:hypothetical protein
VADPQAHRCDRRHAYSRYEISVIDPSAAKVRTRHGFRGWLVSYERTATGVAVLLGPERRLGPARLLVADASGGLRSITLEPIAAGATNPRVRPARYRQPGLTVDPTGRRAYVVAARDRPLVASVELASGQVEYHEPTEAPTARAAKGNIDVRWREARWLGSDSIAVTGFRSRPARRGSRFPSPEEPYGVRLIDTSDWSIRTLAEKPNQLWTGGDRLLAHGTTWSRGWRHSQSTGLLAFDDDGRPLFTRFPGQEVLLGRRDGRPRLRLGAPHEEAARARPGRRAYAPQDAGPRARRPDTRHPLARGEQRLGVGKLLSGVDAPHERRRKRDSRRVERLDRARR